MFINDQALLLRLLIGHIIADFLLQPPSMLINKDAKKRRSGALFLHSGIYSAVVIILASTWKQSLWFGPALFLSHALIDGWKASRGNRTLTFIIDQTAHLAVLGGAFFFLDESALDTVNATFQRIWQSPRILVIVLGYLLVLWPVGRLMSVITDPFRR